MDKSYCTDVYALIWCMLEFLQIQKFFQTTISIWPALDIGPKVNWAKFGQNWPKIEVAARVWISEFLTVFRGAIGRSDPRGAKTIVQSGQIGQFWPFSSRYSHKTIQNVYRGQNLTIWS